MLRTYLDLKILLRLSENMVDIHLKENLRLSRVSRAAGNTHYIVIVHIDK